MRSLLSILLCIILIPSMVACDGNGTNSRSHNNQSETINWNNHNTYSESTQNDSPKNESIEISSEYDLRNIENDPSGSYILTNDIDLSQNSNWSPLCSSEHPFTGTLDGNGYCIKNINVDVKYAESIDDSEYAGLFCCVSGATIKNLGIVGGTVSISSATYDGMAGALAGNSLAETDGEKITLTEVTNCWVNATVESNLIENGSTSYQATMAVGSFFGSGCANFTNCYNLGEVAAASSYADQTIGGFIGAPRTYEQCPMTIKSCYNLGLMRGRHISGDKPGAFIGYSLKNQYVDIIDSYYGTNANEYNKLRIAMTDNKDTAFTSVKGLTVEELKAQSNFSGFDFNDIWAISADKNGGYPYLTVQKSAESDTASDSQAPNVTIPEALDAITFEQAKAIAKDYWKLSDYETTEEDGTKFAIFGTADDAVESNEIKYYYFTFRSLINSGSYSHWTTWDQVFVNSKTGECSYELPADGMSSSNENDQAVTITDNSSPEDLKSAIIGEWYDPNFAVNNYTFFENGSCKMMFSDAEPGTFEITADKTLKITMPWTTKNLKWDSNCLYSSVGWYFTSEGNLIIEGDVLKRQ